VFRWEGISNAADHLEEVAKVYRVVGAEQTCHVGFLPKRLLRRKEEINNKMAVVLEDYRELSKLRL
ncbi:hypothetical protein AeNC1_016346, partial [Aphanomyces euteiches]